MSKQDRGGVRTAQDLERKYPLSDLVGMKKAIKQSEVGLAKTNKIVEDFIKSTVQEGGVTTWYASGEPTLDNAPAGDWTTDALRDSHVGDMYYDRDTGFAYRFTFEDEYKWSIIRDRDTIEALAIANSAYDTADGKRRVFVSEPYPPYENGDLWFDGSDIYICQISKAELNEETGEAEVYVEGDFIIATKYTDDTVANQVGDYLKVLEGTVLTVRESVDQFKVEVYDRDEKTQASIDLIEQSLKTLIKGANGQSLMTQTENGWEFSIESLLNTVDKAVADVEELEGDTNAIVNDLNNVKTVLNEVSKITAYMRFYEDENGDPNLELGTSANGFKSTHTNKGVKFSLNGDVQTDIRHDGMEIERAIIREELQVGGFSLKERANGNAGFVWRGEDS